MRTPIYILLALHLVIMMTACNNDATKGEPAEKFLPASDEYLQVEAESLASAVAKLDTVAAIITTDPLLAAKVRVIDAYLQCMRKTGSVAMRFYSHKQYPEVAGTVLVVNSDRALSATNILGCLEVVGPQLIGDKVELEPCYDVWEYKQDATYFFLYAGTSPMICDFFAANLPREP